MSLIIYLRFHFFWLSWSLSQWSDLGKRGKEELESGSGVGGGVGGRKKNESWILNISLFVCEGMKEGQGGREVGM